MSSDVVCFLRLEMDVSHADNGMWKWAVFFFFFFDWGCLKLNNERIYIFFMRDTYVVVVVSNILTKSCTLYSRVLFFIYLFYIPPSPNLV